MIKSKFGFRYGENKEAIESSKLVGCFYCLRIYESSKITQYCKDKNGYTAICICSIDSVIPYNEKLDGSIDNFMTLLEEENKRAFSNIEE